MRFSLRCALFNVVVVVVETLCLTMGSQGPVALHAAKKSIDVGAEKDISAAMEIEVLLLNRPLFSMLLTHDGIHMIETVLRNGHPYKGSARGLGCV